METEISDKLGEMYDSFVNRYTNFMNSLDDKICSKLTIAGIQTRNNKANGLWCCTLVPTIMILYTLMYPVSELYRSLAFQAIGLLAYSMLFILFITVSSAVIKGEHFGGSVASALFSTLLMYMFSDLSLKQSLFYSCTSIAYYGLLLQHCIVAFPNTFTIGELMVVLQGSVLFVHMMVYTFLQDAEMDDEYLVRSVICIVFATVTIIVVNLAYLHENERTLRHLSIILGGAAVFAIVALHFLLGKNALKLTFFYIFLRSKRLVLLIEWAVLTAIAILVLVLSTSFSEKVDSATRKIFHVLASLVFVLGILQDALFMKLAAGIALGVLILTETLRKAKIEPISNALQSAFEVYRDEKDSGAFAMTAIYLYVGIACPLLLVPEHRGAQLELLSGVLSVGIGDSAASFFGQLYGYTVVSETGKTIEGTLFNVISQYVTVYIFCFFGYLPEPYPLSRTIFAATITALVEARTVQVDNLILSLIMIISLQFASIFLWPLSLFNEGFSKS